MGANKHDYTLNCTLCHGDSLMATKEHSWKWVGFVQGALRLGRLGDIQTVQFPKCKGDKIVEFKPIWSDIAGSKQIQPHLARVQ